ncbi:MAG: MFS transporter, partial [Hylemonella sp.]
MLSRFPVHRPMLEPAWLVILAGVCAALHMGKLPPALPILQQELGISLLQSGFLLSLVQLAGMLFGIFIGLAADGIGQRRSMLIGLGVLALSSLLGACAQDAASLLRWRALEG